MKWISVLKSATLFRSATEKCDLKKHLSLSVAACDRNHASRISRLKLSASMVVLENIKVTAKSLDDYVGIMNRKRSFGSNRRVKVERGQLQCDSKFLKFSNCDRDCD